MNKNRLCAPFGLLLPLLLSCSLLSSAVPPTAAGNIPEDGGPTIPLAEPPDSFRGVPIMPGAQPQDAIAVGQSFTYFIRGTVQEVKEYYLQEMPLAGWDLEDATGDTGGDADSIRLRYRKGGESIAVFINPAETGRVQIVII
jgi:hypothetical protein